MTGNIGFLRDGRSLFFPSCSSVCSAKLIMEDTNKEGLVTAVCSESFTSALLFCLRNCVALSLLVYKNLLLQFFEIARGILQPASIPAEHFSINKHYFRIQ